MIICHCKKLSDRQLREHVRAGARSTRELARACGAGACCGGCRPALDEILAEEQPRAGLVSLRLSA